jgi:hypothetical protein
MYEEYLSPPHFLLGASVPLTRLLSIVHTAIGSIALGAP